MALQFTMKEVQSEKLAIALTVSPTITDRFSVVATFFNFAKSSIGSGSFALPIAVLSAGVVVGSAGMVLLALIR